MKQICMALVIGPVTASFLISNGAVSQDAADAPVAPSEVEASAAAASENPLDALQWMIGTWVDDSGDSKVVTECSLTKNDRFLKRSFSVLIDNDVTLEGDQFVGWDPIERRIRSWTFDSEGGIGEGRWYQDGNRWLVKTSFTLVTGEKASATNVITYIDENTLTWQSIGREVAGELMPSIPEVTVVRQKEEQADSEKPAKEKF